VDEAVDDDDDDNDDESCNTDDVGDVMVLKLLIVFWLSLLMLLSMGDAK
jgi:hypothetical protein